MGMPQISYADINSNSSYGLAVGTAWSVNKSGYWITAKHVVDDCDDGIYLSYNLHNDDETKVILDPKLGKTVVKEVELIEKHSSSDLAVLRSEKNRQYLSISDEPMPEIGLDAYAIGFPKGEAGHVHIEYTGEMARFNNDVLTVWDIISTSKDYDRLGGLSGAPVLDKKGKVYGVAVASSKREKRLLVALTDNIKTLTDDNRIHIDLPPRYKRTIKKSTVDDRAHEIRGKKLISKVYCNR